MSTVCDTNPERDPVRDNGLRLAPDLTGDDGIHISYVTRLDGPFGPLLLVVVSWFEGGHWVERTYELKD